MKRAFLLLAAVLFLAGCSIKNTELDQGLHLRTQILKSSGCSFDADICADYGDKFHTFSLQCTGSSDGSIRFRVAKPQSISGIEGVIDGNDGQLTFDDTALFFPLLADDQVTPVSAPWLLLKTLRTGYLTSAGKDNGRIRLSMDDSYADDALHLDIWLETDETPVRAEILFRERKILSLDVRNFRME